MNQSLVRTIVTLGVLILCAAPLMAQNTTLWIRYRLPENPDLKTAGQALEATARTERTAAVTICSNSRNNIAACERETEITFRGRLQSIPGLKFELWAGPSEQARWLLNLPANLAVNPDWDQNFSHLAPGRIHRLGIHMNGSSCLFQRDTDNGSVRYSNALLAKTVCTLVGFKGHLNDLFVSRWANGNLDEVKFLVESGGDPNISWCCEGTVDAQGRIRFHSETLLYRAVMKGDDKLVMTLLEHGADMERKGGPAGATALIGAAGAGQTDLVRQLLDRGANVNATDDNGETALVKAGKGGHTAASRLIRQRLGIDR